MDDIIKNSTNPTVAPYAKDNEMLFRVTARGKDKAECEKIMEPVVNEIYNRLGDYIYGEDDETLVSSIMKILELKVVPVVWLRQELLTTPEHQKHL